MNQLFVSDFWLWWLCELKKFVPVYVLSFFKAYRQDQLFIRLADYQVFFFVYENGKEKLVAKFYLTNEDKIQKDIFLSQSSALFFSKKILLLNRRQAVSLIISLPLVAKNNLLRIIGYELDRYAPCSQEKIYNTAQITKINRENNQIDVELVYTTRNKLHYYYQELSQWGLDVDIIRYDNRRALETSDADYNLLPESFRLKKVNYPFFIIKIAGFFFLMLLFVSVALPFWLQQRTVDILEKQAQIYKKQAQEVEQIKEKGVVLLNKAKTIEGLKRSSPAVTKILLELTHLLPEHTWLISFKYDNRTVTLQGLSASAYDLINLLENSSMFVKTSFVSPVSKDMQSGLDHFELSAQVKVQP